MRSLPLFARRSAAAYQDARALRARALSRERQIDADAARRRSRRDTDMTRFIVRCLQAILWKQVALLGRRIAPQPTLS
jgi:hypothetical protein